MASTNLRTQRKCGGGATGKFSPGIRQPFRQAFRESYEVSEGERETRMYFNRFAGIYLRQHQLASLCRARGWEYRLMGTFRWAQRADAEPGAMEHAGGGTCGPAAGSGRRAAKVGTGRTSWSGINLFVEPDQVRFYRDRREIAVDEVPAILYSEVMRDVDLFTWVCAIGEDESWTDQGDRGIGVADGRLSLWASSRR